MQQVSATPPLTQRIEMMRCDRQAMTLTKAGCIRLWKSTQEQRPAEHEGRYKCLTCPVGAAHAGVPMAPTAAATEALRKVCPRCRRRGLRQIGGRLCVSCYNRNREVQVGRNAKGGRPLLSAILHPDRLAVIAGGETRMADFPAIVDLTEAMLDLARHATGPLAFGRPPARFA